MLFDFWTCRAVKTCACLNTKLLILIQATDFNQEGQKMGHNIHEILMVSFVTKTRISYFPYRKIT